MENFSFSFREKEHRKNVSRQTSCSYAEKPTAQWFEKACHHCHRYFCCRCSYLQDLCWRLEKSPISKFLQVRFKIKESDVFLRSYQSFFDEIFLCYNYFYITIKELTMRKLTSREWSMLAYSNRLNQTLKHLNGL